MQPYNFQGTAAGGNGGNAFDDQAGAPQKITGIHSIQLTGDTYIDSIQVTYYLADGSPWQGPKHGGDGGNAYPEINFGVGETIYKISGNYGAYIDSMTIYTVKPDGSTTAYGPYGGSGGDAPYIFYGAISAIYGSADSYLDNLGVYNIVWPSGK